MEKLLLLFFRAYFNSLGLINLNHSARLLISIFSKPRKRVFRKKEVKVLSKAKKGQIIFENKTLELYEWGEGEKLALLIHGWESNAGSLGAFVEPLVSAGYKVIGFDAPAHGKSQGRKANLIYFKNATIEMIKKYGVPDICIGHSLGANTILLTAYETKINFDKVILISPLDRLMSVFEMYRSILRLPSRVFKAFLNKFGEQTGYKLEGFYFHTYAEESSIADAVIFHGIRDQMTLFEHAEGLSKNWTKARLEAIEKSGHYGILWNPDVIEKARLYINN